MALRVPTSADILNRIMIRLAGGFAPLTDATQISAVRMLIQGAIIEEFAALWAALSEEHERWFVNTGRGDRLDRRVADFPVGATREPARRAYGDVSVTVSAPTDVQPGATVFVESAGNPGTQYAIASNDNPDTALGDVGNGSWHIAANTSRLLRAVALVAGAGGNTSAGTITGSSGISGVVEILNPSPIINGRDAESDDELKQKFRDYWELLRTGTRGAIIAAGRKFIAVDSVTGETRRAASVALEGWDGASLLEDAIGNPVSLRIYLDEGVGVGATGTATASDSLVQAFQRLIDGSDTQADPGIVEAGAPVVVMPARALGIRVAVVIDVDPAYNAPTVATSVRETIIAHFARLGVAGLNAAGELQGQVHLPHLFRDIVDVAGVLRATMSNPTSNVGIPPGYRAVVSRTPLGHLELDVVTRLAA